MKIDTPKTVPATDLYAMMGYYMDCFSGNVLNVTEAFDLMREYGFVNENDEEDHGFY